MLATVAIQAARNSRLTSGRLSLVIGCWLSVVGEVTLVTGCRLSVVGFLTVVLGLEAQEARRIPENMVRVSSVSYTHLTLPTMKCRCRSRWSPYH